jgi:hypothetical protein
MRTLPRFRVAAAVTLALQLALLAMLPWGTAAQSQPGGEVSAQGCSIPGTLPVVAEGEAGSDAVAITESTEGISLAMPDGTVHDLPAGQLRFEPGMAIVLQPDGTRTVLSPSLGQVWTFAPVSYSDGPDSAPFASAPFVQAGPYVAGPIAEDGRDWQIVDTRTGATRTTSEIVGGPFPIGSDAYALPAADGPAAIAGIRFQRIAEPIGADAATDPALVNVGATLIIPGTLDEATFIDLAPGAEGFHDSDPRIFPGAASAVFSGDRTRVAWAASEGEPFGDVYEILVADTAALDQPERYLAPGAPENRVPVLFTPDGTALLALVDNGPSRIDVATGEAFPAAVDGLTPESVRIDNPVDGTVIFDTGAQDAPEMWLYDAATDTTTRLPELDAYPWPYPLTGHTFAGATPLTDGMAATTPVLIDTRTGSIVAVPEGGATQPATGSPIEGVGHFQDGILVAGHADGTVRVQNGTTGEAWTMTLPEGIEPGLSLRLTIAPGGSCLLLSAYLTDTTVPFSSSLAPLEQGGSWTPLPEPVSGWWQTAPE